MHEMVGVGRNGVRAEMDGDHYRPCKGRHFSRVSPVLPARSVPSKNH